jgi:S-DNA-T family DNA segregation ATPase FtsK/SpoIIIE
MLVGGHVGTGKSVLLHSIIFGLIFRWKPSEVQLALYDHKVEEFKRYGTLPHLWHPVADSTKKFDLLLEKLEDELERRKRIRGLDDQAKFPLLVVIMDEFRGLASMRLTTLISECRSLGMTFILATQYPKAEEVSTPIKANLTTRVSFRMRDSTGSRLILGESGGETLMDQGDCLVSTSYCFEHAQAAHCRNEDLKAVENYLKTLGH